MITFLISCLFCVAIVAWRFFSQFGHTDTKGTDQDISGFFRIDEISQRNQKNFLSVVSLLPLTCLFAISLFYSDVLVQAIISFILASFDFPYDNPSSFFDHDTIPKSMRPIVIAAFLLVAFGEKLSRLQNKIEEKIILLFRIRQNANELLESVSTVILGRTTYRQANVTLEQARNHPIRIPRVLLGTSDNPRLSFQLLQLATSRVPTLGLHDAVIQITEEYFSDILLHVDRDNLRKKTIESTRYLFMYRILFTYAIFVCAYVALVPLAAEYFHSLEIAWPEYQHTAIQLREIGVRTFAAFLPVVVATIYMQSGWIRFGEMKGSVIYTIASAVFLWCLFVNFLNISIYLLQVDFRTGGFSWALEENAVAGISPEVTHIVAYSIVPSVAVVAILLTPHSGQLDRWKSILGALIFGVGFLLAQMLFEYQAKWDNYYFWHQGLLGLILGFAGLAPATGRQRESTKTVASNA